MPTYRFQCTSCGLNFTARAAPTAPSMKCQCGSLAGKDLPSGSSHVAMSTAGDTTGPTTTGFSGVDYNEDRAIGEYSAKKWKVIETRRKAKEDIIREAGVTGFDLSRTPDGDYRVMDPRERVSSERARSWHHGVMRHRPK